MGQNSYDYTGQGQYKDVQKKGFTFLGLRHENKVFSINGDFKYPNIQGDRIKLPIVIFLNGFLIDLSYYNYIADRLASWGFIVVQYDISKIFSNTDADQVRIFTQIIDNIKSKTSQDKQYLGNSDPDFDNIGIAGHSRGGKLSTLIFTGGFNVKSACTIDPVDNNYWTPLSKDYPSAIQALSESQVPIGIIGMGVVGSCNPKGNNSFNFFDASPKGSFFYEIVNSGHMQVLDGFAFAKSLCARGSNSDEKTQQLILPPITAWLRRTLYKDDESNFDKFLDYAKAEQDNSVVKYAFKQNKEDYEVKVYRHKKAGHKREIIIQN